MAEKVAIVGEADGKPLSTELKNKISNALKKELQTEFRGPGTVVGTHHISVTHFSVVYDAE